MKRISGLFSIVILLTMGLLWQGCSEQQPPSEGTSSQPTRSSSTNPDEFVIYAGSEMAGLEPMITIWAHRKGYNIRMYYKGSIDMMGLMAYGTQGPADAYWPAHTIWFILGDTAGVVKNKRSIMVSPIVVGMKTSVVKRLGWDRNLPTLAEFMAAAKADEFKFAKTSSTQSNSGALFHLAAWHTFAGQPETWSIKLVKDPKIQSIVKEMESSVAATSGSSGWLKSKILESSELDAMVNYEAMVSEANIGWTTIEHGKKIVHQGLIERGREPLHVIYLKDATMLADHPLGFVDRGSESKAQIFKELQAFLLGTEAQKEMIRLGRRTKLLGMDSSLADKNAFNPKHGFDVDRIISPINPPHEEVLTAILDLYQEQVRKPSATYWIIDDSGSMYKNGGKKAVQEAMRILLDPTQARRFKLQPTAKDIHVVIPFSAGAGTPLMAQGNDPSELAELMNQIETIEMRGGTNMFAGVIEALHLIKQEENNLSGHFPAIAVLSDGVSEGSLADVLTVRERLGLNYIPIHTLSFGSGVDEKQLHELAAAGGGRYFSVKKDVAHAFRKMKGYN
ncbi:MAG: VWA domain-containing protein [Desulfobacterales bacterium]|jgi:Ca-activated chloride channel family protein